MTKKLTMNRTQTQTEGQAIDNLFMQGLASSLSAVIWSFDPHKQTFESVLEYIPNNESKMDIYALKSKVCEILNQNVTESKWNTYTNAALSTSKKGWKNQTVTNSSVKHLCVPFALL